MCVRSGGVRYLEKAVMQLDKGQFDLVREALFERTNFFAIAPHLARQLPIITPRFVPSSNTRIHPRTHSLYNPSVHLV